MIEVDVGDACPSVFTRVEYDDWGRPVAAFVSSDGEAFCLDKDEVELRIRFLAAKGEESAEEHRALQALAAVGAG
jgi:hypothetical protein